MRRRGIAILTIAALGLSQGCNEKTCEDIPPAGFARPTALAFSSDGKQLFVVSGNGNRRTCEAFLSALDLDPDGSPNASWNAQLPLPGLPGDLRVSTEPDQLLVPTLLPDGDGISGKLVVLRPDLTLLQTVPTSRGPFWSTLHDTPPADRRLILSSLPDQRIDILKWSGGSWQSEETIALGSALFRSGPSNLGSTGLSLPERAFLHGSAPANRLLIADSAIYSLPLENGTTTSRGLLWIHPLDRRDQLFWAYTGLRPRSLAVDEQRSIAYVTNLGTSSVRGEISVVDLTPPTDDSRVYFTLDLDAAAAAAQGIAPASDAAPYELLLADDGITLFATDLRRPRVYEVNLAPLMESLQATGAASLRQWAERIVDREENPADYFPAATVHTFEGSGAAFLAYDPRFRRLAVSDPTSDQIWIYSRPAEIGSVLR